VRGRRVFNRIRRMNDMRNRPVTGFTILAVWLLATGCADADNRADAGRYGAPQSEAQTPSSKAIEPLRDQASKDKDKRGNTPPGTDRTGAGPAEGAILDPTGAVTKQPVLRER
jgi:hypothetical protein